VVVQGDQGRFSTVPGSEAGLKRIQMISFIQECLELSRHHSLQHLAQKRDVGHRSIILAINRGENLKVLTVKVSISDGVKIEFSKWCVNERWRPKAYATPELMELLRFSVEDAYKRLIYPLLCREFRSKLTSDAEKESVMMFGRNLRQLLLTGPVRGRTLMGVDPGYKHGCKLAIISPTSQILHTDVVYLHSGKGFLEAQKIRKLLLDYNCSIIVIGNGTACRETEAYFADLITKKYFAPVDVTYCITNEAGASIYSVSPDACKEMPDLDPNLRSAVSIARRVQDPLAELVKIEPKHIGVGMYQVSFSRHRCDCKQNLSLLYKGCGTVGKISVRADLFSGGKPSDLDSCPLPALSHIPTTTTLW
ncbi:S1 RNA-binding domain-containing protein 1, partial [Varanus komodoensis]